MKPEYTKERVVTLKDIELQQEKVTLLQERYNSMLIEVSMDLKITSLSVIEIRKRPLQITNCSKLFRDAVNKLYNAYTLLLEMERDYSTLERKQK